MNGVAALGERAGHRARRSARGDQRGVPGVDRLCARAPSAERARGARHARRSGAEARAAARRRCARRGACEPSSRSRPREAHELLVVSRSVSSSARRRSTLLVERTEGWPAALVLAWLWLRTVEDPARAVRAFGGDHRFVAEYLSSEVLAALDEDDARVPPRRRGARRVHRGALRRRARPHRFGGAARRARALEPVRLEARSEAAGFGSTRCSPSTRGLSSPRSTPDAPSADSSTCRRVAQVARVAGRSGRARGRGRRPRARRASCWSSTTCR